MEVRCRGQAEECMKVVESSRVVAASVLWWRGADREGRLVSMCGGSKVKWGAWTPYRMGV